MVNSPYLPFVWKVLAQAEVQEKVSARIRQVTRVRSFVTLAFLLLQRFYHSSFHCGALDWYFARICSRTLSEVSFKSRSIQAKATEPMPQRKARDAEPARGLDLVTTRKLDRFEEEFTLKDSKHFGVNSE